MTQVLAFRLQRAHYAVRLSALAELGEVGPIRAIPGAPAGVLGLVEWGGRLVTVVDLPGLLDDGPHSHPASLLRLAAPSSHVALYVPAVLQLAAEPCDENRRLIEPAELLGRLASAGS